MQIGLRYLTSVLVFLTVGLLLLTAYPLLKEGESLIVVVIIFSSAMVGIVAFFLSGRTE
jgi:hypothetical protein